MSAATASSIETIFVRLLGEGVGVWRPVGATPLGSDVFRLESAAVLPDEDWEFAPGDVVRVDLRRDAGRTIKVARAAMDAETRRAG